MLTFEQPQLLLLLVPVCVLVYLAWRTMSLPFPKRQRRLILACRLALFTLIICALAGAAWSQPVTRQSVVFVGDISASAGPQRAFIESWINSALKHKGPDDQVGIVAVGRNALVEQSVKKEINFNQFQSTPDTNYTDLAAGLRLAAAILPSDSQRRIVLLSDGQQNLGDALQEAQLLQQEGIRLDIVPLPGYQGAEARIDGLAAPTELRTNERFLLHTRIFSNVVQPSTLRLYLDQTLLLQVSTKLVIGAQEFTFRLLAPPPGFHTFRVTLEAAHDTILANNEAAAFVNVQGPPRVLVIEGTPGEGHNIIAALQATKIQVTVGTPGDIPSSLDGLAGFSSIVLADVPALSLGNARMLLLQAYVRDLGRGLVVSGGENSYGVGGYSNTPLEQTLPVKMDIPQHKDTPSIAVVLIVESLEDNSGINISKEAAKGVVGLLTPRDQVGISAGCGVLVSAIQHVTNRGAIDQVIDTMEPCDPGSYLPDLLNAETALRSTNAKIQHVILLGDGDTSENFQLNTLLLRMASEHITISTVATNANSYQELGLMQQIASLGRGRFYRADNPAAIPQILLKETQQATRRAIINEPFVPVLVGNHPIATGLSAFPGLTGYVATTPKATAQIVLISHKDDPVLAVWQYGLGRVAAWTSDALGLWTANWLRWNDASRWWANLVTWTLPSPDSSLDVNATVVGGSGHLTVDLPAGTSTGAAVNQQTQVKIIAPNLSQETISLQPTAPLRWEGNFPTIYVGAYLLQVSWQGSGHQLATTTGLVVPYSPEFHTMGTDTRFLSMLAHAGGGTLLGANDSKEAFSANLAPVSAAVPLAFLLLTLAALLLPIDIAARRLSSLEFLVIGFEWLRARLRPRLALQGKQGGESAINVPVLESLRTKREEQRRRAASTRSQTINTGGTTATTATTATKIRGEQATGSVKGEKTPVNEADASTASKLLEAKRERERSRGQK
jgi:uncharacterized membrane protein